MNPTTGQARVLVDKLEEALRRCERAAGLDVLELTVEALAPKGPKLDTLVTFKPTPAKAEVLKRATDDVKQAVAAFEDETECWVETIYTAWTNEEPPRRFLRCTFRAAY